MALDDNAEKALRDELAQLKAKLAETQKLADEFKDAEAKRNAAKPNEERPERPKMDPDIAKTLAEVQKKIEVIEQRLGVIADRESGYQLPDFFRVK